MEPLFVPTLRRGERRRIERAAARARQPKYRDKCRAILWSADRRPVTEIATLLGVDATTVCRWIHDYRRFGFRGLEVGKSTGRPRLLDADGEAALERALARNPRDLGYVFTRWTLPTLAEHLRACIHVRIAPATLGKAMKRLGYSYVRPKLSLKHKQDPRRVARAKRDLARALKKGRSTPTASPSSSRTSASSTSTPASTGNGAASESSRSFRPLVITDEFLYMEDWTRERES